MKKTKLMHTGMQEMPVWDTEVPHAVLKKNEREEAEESAKQEAAMHEFLLDQQRARSEPLSLPYTFRSESTQRELPSAVHKGNVVVTCGLTAVRHSMCDPATGGDATAQRRPVLTLRAGGGGQNRAG